MTETAASEGSHNEQLAIQLEDPPAPTSNLPVGNAAQVQMGSFRSPRKIIAIFDPDEWEEFTYEWARVLEGYEKVLRVTGAGDRGADIVGFADAGGFQGVWDCYQCKHYDHALQPAEAYDEIFKVLHGVAIGHWVMPRAYYFVAPRECGPTLKQLLNNAGNLAVEFKKRICAPNYMPPNKVTAAEMEGVKNLADTVDFSVFQDQTIDDVLEVHKKTQYYVLRFGGGIPLAPAAPPVPNLPKQEEAPYLRALLPIYREKYGDLYQSFEECATESTIAKHLLRQREAFYSAETLERHVRDLLPHGSYAAFQEDIFAGVIEVRDLDYGTGYERLAAVLSKSTDIDLSSSAVVQACRPIARKGACHQLAGLERLSWMDPS